VLLGVQHVNDLEDRERADYAVADRRALRPFCIDLGRIDVHLPPPQLVLNQLKAVQLSRQAFEPFDPRRPVPNGRDVDPELTRDFVQLITEWGADLRGDLKGIAHVVREAGDFPLERVNRVFAEEELVEVDAKDEHADGMDNVVSLPPIELLNPTLDSREL